MTICAMCKHYIGYHINCDFGVPAKCYANVKGIDLIDYVTGRAYSIQNDAEICSDKNTAGRCVDYVPKGKRR